MRAGHQGLLHMPDRGIQKTVIMYELLKWLSIDTNSREDP